MRVLSWKLGLRPSHTRIPFKYGEACLTDCPQALLCTEFLIDGQNVSGYAADCLPPLWFDKDSSRTFGQQIEDMQAVIAVASQQLLEHGEFENLFVGLECLGGSSFDLSRPRLLHSFGISMVERCIIDALCRYHSIPFRKLLSSGRLYGDQALEVKAATGDPTHRAHRPKRMSPRHFVRRASQILLHDHQPRHLGLRSVVPFKLASPEILNQVMPLSMLPLQFLNSLTVELLCLLRPTCNRLALSRDRALSIGLFTPNAMALVGFNYLFAMANCHKH